MYNLKKYKVARRLGAHLFEKTQTEKFSLRAERYVGKMSKKRGRGATDYGLQMLEKQRVRAMYGVRERQFSNYVSAVISSKSTDKINSLYEVLESRLDNAVYRSGLAPTRQASRQLVSHGHILVNGTRTTIPSFSVSIGDVITVRNGSKTKRPFTSLSETRKGYTAPSWMTSDLSALSVKITGKPALEQGSLIDLGQVIEFYKR